MANFHNWIRMAREHWKEHQRKLYHQLKASGTLEAALKDAAERTYRELTELEEAGYDPQGAWEMVRERYLFPPEAGSLAEMIQRDAHEWRPSAPATATEILHAAMRSGAREIEIPHPSGSKTK